MNRETDELTVKYKGITIFELEWKELAFNDNYNAPEPFRHYVIKQGRAMYQAIQAGEIPEGLLLKAKKIDECGEGLGESYWESTPELTDQYYENNTILHPMSPNPFEVWTAGGLLQYIPNDAADLAQRFREALDYPLRRVRGRNDNGDE